jgi:HEAT repeat protein/lysophospholipase L1-like esterase
VRVTLSAARRGLLVNLLLSLAVTLGFALALEGVARWLESRRPPPPRAAYLWDWETMWDGDFYTVGAGALGWPPWEEFNADGVRDRAHAEEPRPRTFRLVFLGDSVTLGAGIAADEAYPQVLQRRLAAEGRRIEVFNVALWGWSTRQQRTAYARIVRRYRPERVVLAVCLNDVAELQNNLARPPAWLQRLHERSALARLVVDAQGREIRQVEELFTRPDARGVREGFERFFAEVRALRAEVEADGAAFALIVFPFRFQVEPDAPPPAAQARFESFCRAEALACLDLLPALSALGPAAFVDYDHLSAEGARLTARTLAESALVPPGYSYADDLGPLAPANAPLGPLLGALQASDPARREAAVWALGRRRPVPEARVAGALAARLAGDPDPGVRRAAAEALGRSPAGALAAAGALFRALDDASANVRRAAARALATRPPRRTQDDAEIDRLIAALGHDDLYARAFAAWSLGRLGPSAARAAPALVEALQLEGRSRGVAARTLARLGPAAAQAAIPALTAALDSPEAPRRWNAALALGLLGPPARTAVPSLVARLDDAEPRVRAHAARALGRIGAADPAVAGALAAVLRRDGDADVRAMAVRALGRLGASDPAARRALEAARGDDVRRVRVEAQRALDALRAGAPDRDETAEPE